MSHAYHFYAEIRSTPINPSFTRRLLNSSRSTLLSHHDPHPLWYHLETSFPFSAAKELIKSIKNSPQTAKSGLKSILALIPSNHSSSNHPPRHRNPNTIPPSITSLAAAADSLSPQATFTESPQYVPIGSNHLPSSPPRNQNPNNIQSSATILAVATVIPSP